MSILVYDGLRELIKREFIDRNMATTDATVDSATNLIRTVMEDYRGKALQLVGTTLPSTGVPGTIYLQSKSEPNEKNRFIAYAYEDGKFVQVGSSFFPEDFAPDSELNINSQVTVENRVLKSAIDDKFNLSGVINNVIPTEPNSVHAKDTPTSAAIQAELATKLGYEDGSRITREQLWQVFRPELARLVYPFISMVITNSSDPLTFRRLEGKDILTNVKYKSGLTSITNNYTNYWGSDGNHYNNIVFTDVISERDIRLNLFCTGCTSSTGWSHYHGPAFFDSENYPSEYVGTTNTYSAFFKLDFTFTNPVPIGLLYSLFLNIAPCKSRKMRITTKISDTGEANTYTTIQDNVEYDYTYTEGIPFYGFDKRS